jgi:hypothetical protein
MITKCYNCVFCTDKEFSESTNIFEGGICRLHPPTVVYSISNRVYSFEQPEVTSDCSCGDGRDNL